MKNTGEFFDRCAVWKLRKLSFYKIIYKEHSYRYGAPEKLVFVRISMRSASHYGSSSKYRTTLLTVLGRRTPSRKRSMYFCIGFIYVSWFWAMIHIYLITANIKIYEYLINQKVCNLVMLPSKEICQCSQVKYDIWRKRWSCKASSSLAYFWSYTISRSQAVELSHSHSTYPQGG